MARSSQVTKVWKINNLQKNTMFYLGLTISVFIFSLYFFIHLLKPKHAALFVMIVVILLLTDLFYIPSYVNGREFIAVLKTELWLIPSVYQLDGGFSVLFAI